MAQCATVPHPPGFEGHRGETFRWGEMFQVSHFEDNNRNKTLIYINNENWLSGDIELVICDSFSAGMIISWYCEIRKRTHFRKATQFALVEKLAMARLSCFQILQKEKPRCRCMHSVTKTYQ